MSHLALLAAAWLPMVGPVSTDPLRFVPIHRVAVADVVR